MAKRKTPKGLATTSSPRTNKPYSTQKSGMVTAKMMSDMAPGAKPNKMMSRIKMPKVVKF